MRRLKTAADFQEILEKKQRKTMQIFKPFLQWACRSTLLSLFYLSVATWVLCITIYLQMHFYFLFFIERDFHIQ